MFSYSIDSIVRQVRMNVNANRKVIILCLRVFLGNIPRASHIIDTT